MANGSPEGHNYFKPLFDTISQDYIARGYSGPVEIPQLLSDPLDAGIAPFQEVNARRGQLQGGWNQFGNMLMQTLAEVGGGTIEGIGYIGEVGNIGGMIRGTEEEFGNALSDFGKSIKDETREAFPIYQDYGEGFHPGNYSWWMTHAPSIASTLSLMIPSGLAVKGLSAMAKTALKATGMLDDIGKMKGTIGWAKVLTQAGISRHMENMMESSQTFDQIYEENIKIGMTDADARQNAAIAASSVYNKNWAMLTQDIIQYAFLRGAGKGLGKMTASADEVMATAKAMGKSIIPIGAKSALKGLANMAGEGFEEGYQFVVQKEGEYLAQKALNPDIESTFGERMKEYMSDGEMWTSAFFGALGAGVMQGTMKGINRKLTQSNVRASRVRAEDIGSWGADMSRHLKTMRAVQETGNTNLVQGTVDIGLANLLTKSSIHGNLNDFKEFVERLGTEEPTQKDLDQFGVTKEDAYELSKLKDELLSDANRFEQIFNDNMEKAAKNEWASPDHAVMASRTEYLIEKLNTRRLESKDKSTELESKIANLDKLSYTGQQLKQVQGRNSALRGIVKSLDRLAKEVDVESKETAYAERAAENREEIEDNKILIESLKEALTPEEKASDAKVRLSSKAVGEWQKELNQQIALENVINDLQNTLEKLENGEMPYKQVPKVDTIEEAETAKEIPQVKDGIVYTNPETGVWTAGIVLKVENDSEYTIQLYDDEGNILKDNSGRTPLGTVVPPFVTSVETLTRIMASSDIDPNVEPDDTTPEPQEEEEAETGPNVGRSIAWYGQDKATEPELNKVVSDPTLSKEDKDNAEVEFHIDFTYRRFWDKRTELQKEIQKGPLTKKRIDELLSSIALDNIPIKITLKLKGERYTDLYVRDVEGKWLKLLAIPASITRKGQEAIDKFIANEKAKVKRVRANILKVLLVGDKAVTKGINNNDVGHPNNVKKGLNRGDIEERRQAELNSRTQGRTERERAEEKGWIDRKDSTDVGHEKIRLTGERHHEGNKYGVKEFQDHNSEDFKGDPYELIIKTVSPEEHTDGKLSKAAEVIVGQFDSREAGEKWLEEFEKKQDQKIIQLTKEINAKYDAELRGDIHQNIPEAWNQDINEIQIGIGDKDGLLNLGGGNIKRDIPVKKGSIFGYTTKTPNGAPAIIQLNRTKLSRDHAEILWEALRVAHHKDGGSKAPMTDPRVEGMTAGEVMRFLAFMKETTPEELEGYELGKQMYVKKDPASGSLTLYYGTNSSIFMSNQLVADMKKAFVDWAVANKNYPTYIDDRTLGTKGFNEVWEKKFKLGALEHDGKSSHAALMMKNNLLTTDVVEFVPGSLFEGPNLQFNDLGIKSTEKTKTKPITKSNQEKVKKEEPKLPIFSEDHSPSQIKGLYGSYGIFITGVTRMPNGTYKIINEDGSVKIVDSIESLAEDIKNRDPEYQKRKDITIKEILNRIKTEYSISFVKGIEPTIEVPNDIDDIGLFDDIDGPLRPYSDETIVVQDLTKELKSVRKMLGKRVSGNFEEVDRILAIAKTGKKGWATYRHDVIKIYNAAEIGTAYHEAFHRVSLGYHTSEERSAVYEAARREYGLRGLTDMEVEEELAEKFRVFVLSKGERKYSNVIKDFFTRLWNHIKTFFTGPTRLTSPEINRLFESIWEGEYRRTKLSSDKFVINEEILRARHMYGREFDNIDTVNQLRDVVKGLAYRLIRTSQASDLNGEIKELDWTALRNKVEVTVAKLRARINIDEGDPTKVDSVQKAKRRLDLYTDILGYSEATGRFAGFDVMKELITSFLSSMNIEVTQDEPDNFSDGINDGLGIEDKGKASFETSVKENALGSVKLKVALLQASAEKNPNTGMPQFVNYNEVWNMLLGDLYDLDNIEDMVIRLGELSTLENRYHYLELMAILESEQDKDFKNQFLATFRKHRHAFMNAYADFIKGEVTSYSFTDADVRSVSRMKVNEWGLNFYASSNVIKKEGEEPIVSEIFIKDITEEHKLFAKEIRNESSKVGFEDKVDGYYDEALALLAKMSIHIDRPTLDALVDSKTEDRTGSILAVLDSDIKRIIENVLPNPKNVPIPELYKDGAVNLFGNAFAEAHPELMNSMVLGPASAQYYTFANHSVVTSLIRDIKNNPQVAEELRKQRFNRRSKFLEMFAEDDNARKGVRVRTFGGVWARGIGDDGRDYMSMTPEEDYILALHTTINGLVNFPTLAGKKTYYFLDGMNVIDVELNKIGEGAYRLGEATMDRLFDHVLDERDRIVEAREDRAKLSKDKLVENYHVVNGDTSLGRAYDFTLFSKFEYDTFDEASARSTLDQQIEVLVRRELKKAASMGVILTDKDGQWKSVRLDKGLLQKKKELYGSEHAAIVAIFTEFVVRSIDNNIELHKMFIGDPAFYKGKVDLGKRLGALIASGEEMAISTNNYGVDLTRAKFNVATISTQKYESAYYPGLLEAFTDRIGATRAKETLQPYKTVENADGQSFITPMMYRSISIRIGEWSRDKDNAFDLLQSKEPLTIEQEAEALKVVLNPLKTVYFGYDPYFGMALPIYDKMSMAPLFRRVVAGKQIEELLNRMEDPNNPIDMVKMDSAVKVGQRGAVPLWKDKGQTTMNDLTDIPVFTQSFKNLRRQQVVPVHEDERTNAGSQVIKIAMANLNKTQAVYFFKGKHDGKTGEEVASIINTGLGALSKYGQEEADAEFGYRNGKLDRRRLVAKMRKEAKKANMPMSTIDAIRETDGKMYLNPDAFPNRKWFMTRLISAFTKKIVKRKLPGGQMVQVSNLGYRDANVTFDYENASEDDRVTWLRDTNDIPFIHMDNGRVVPMGAVVSINLFKHLIPNYEQKTWAEKVAYIKNQDLDILGYRIPTQGQNSTVALTVVGVLPEQFGDVIMLPSEFTALTGSDFDIDKLFVIHKNYTRNEKGNIKEIDFIINDDDRAYESMLMYKFNVYKSYLSDNFKEWYRKNNYDRIENIGEEIDQDIEETKQRLEIASEQKKKMYEDVLANLYDERDDIKEEKDLYTFDLKGLADWQKAELRNRIQTELIKEGFIQTEEDFAKLSDHEKNIPKAIENAVINAYLSILTSPDHITKTAAPLGGLKNKLTTLAETVRSKQDELYPPMLDELTPKYQSDLKNKFSMGGMGTGPFALHNSHHVLTQLVEYKIKGSISPLQNTIRVPSKINPDTNVTAVDFAAITGKDKVDIMDWLSVLIDAHVDLGTDPFIVDLNVNAFTYDIVGYLIRSGVGEQTFKFLSNPAIRIASRIFLNNRKSMFNRNNMTYFDAIREAKKELASSGGFELSDVAKEVESRVHEVLDNEVSLETNWFDAKPNRDYYIDQIAILDKVLQIKSYADILSADLHSSQIDTANYGSSMIGLESFFNKIKQSMDAHEKGDTFNYDKIVPYDYTELATEKKEGEIFIADYYRNALVHMIDVFSDLTLDSTVLFRDTIRAILTTTGNKNSTDQKLIDKVGNELYSALLGHFAFRDMFGMNASKTRGLFIGDANVFKMFDALRADKSLAQLFKDNAFLNRLNTFVNQKSIVKNYFIMKDTDFKDSMEIDDVVYSWEELLSHPDDRVSKFARRMFLYNFYTSGFNNRIHSFNSLVPPSMMKEIIAPDGNVYSIDGIITGLLNSMDSDNMRPQMARIMDDILSHGTFSPVLDWRFTFSEIVTPQGTVYTTQNKKLVSGIDRNGNVIASPYIKHDGATYKYRGYGQETSDLIYTKIDNRGYTKEGRFVQEYGLEDSLFKEQAIVKEVKEFTPTTIEAIELRLNTPIVEVDSINTYFDTLTSNQDKTVKDISLPEVIKTKEFTWERVNPDGYEVSSQGDKRFSALNATLSTGETIEAAYQRLKGTGKGKPAADSTFNYWGTYLGLWKQWATENPKLIEELRQLASSGILLDRFANTENNQARALATILNETSPKLVSVDKLSRPGSPLEIFVDGSSADETTGKFGYGAWMEYNGEPYRLSGASAEIAKVKEVVKGEKIDNTTMELVGLNAVLKKFVNTGEHLRIWQDLEHISRWKGLNDRATKSIKHGDYTPGTVVTKEFVKRAVEYIEQIEANGGSVDIRWLKAHPTKAEIKEYPELYTDDATTARLIKGNNMADESAGSITSKDTFKDLLALRETYREEEKVFPDIVYEKMEFEDGTGGRKMQTKFQGKSTMDLVLSGDRTATSRSYKPNLNVGDLVVFTDKQGRSAMVEVTKAPYPILTISAEEWAKLEGWQTSVYKNIEFKDYWQYQFKLAEEVNQELKPNEGVYGDGTGPSVRDTMRLPNFEEEGERIKNECKGV